MIAAIAALRLGGFAGTTAAAGVPALLAVVYAMIALSIGLSGYVIWRGIPIDIDEKLNVSAMTRNAVAAFTWLAARLNIRLPDTMRQKAK